MISSLCKLHFEHSDVESTITKSWSIVEMVDDTVDELGWYGRVVRQGGTAVCISVQLDIAITGYLLVVLHLSNSPHDAPPLCISA